MADTFGTPPPAGPAAPVSREHLAEALHRIGLPDLLSVAAVHIYPTHLEVARYVYLDDGSRRDNLLTGLPMTNTTRIEIR